MAAEPSIATLGRGERRDFFYWRLLGTALSYLLFGAGAVVVGVVLLPIVRLMPATREQRRTRARQKRIPRLQRQIRHGARPQQALDKRVSGHHRNPSSLSASHRLGPLKGGLE